MRSDSQPVLPVLDNGNFLATGELPDIMKFQHWLNSRGGEVCGLTHRRGESRWNIEFKGITQEQFDEYQRAEAGVLQEAVAR